MPENSQLVLLSDLQTKTLSMVASSWLDYYYRPLVFPDEYFEHYRPSMRYRMIKPHLPTLYASLKEAFIASCLNPPTWNTWKMLNEKRGREDAQKFFEQVWYFVDYALNQYPTVQKLREATNIPMAGRLVSVVEQFTTKESLEKMKKVKGFLSNLFLNDYPNWMKTFNGELYAL